MSKPLAGSPVIFVFDRSSDQPASQSWRQFIIIVVTSFLTASGVTIAASIAIFWRAGEYWSTAQILSYQAAQGGLYRTVSTDAIMAPLQRLERFRLLQPEIIVLGSSRVLQFRSSHFLRPFTNMGMSLDYRDLPNIARALVREPTRLRTVILSLDHWQFNDISARGAARERDMESLPDLGGLVARLRDRTSQYVTAPINLLAQGRLSLHDAKTILCHCDPDTDVPNHNIGVGALLDGSGLDREGSYHYTWAFDKNSQPRGFDVILDRIAHGTDGFEYSDGVNDSRFANLKSALSIFDAAGIHTSLIMPPVAPAVADAMKASGRYGIIDDFARRLEALNRPFFNFHDPRSFGSSACEFADGFHGGEVTALRMLHVMLQDPRTDLSAIVDAKRIDQLIATYAGRVNAYDQPLSGDVSRHETDFLGIGCLKPS